MAKTTLKLKKPAVKVAPAAAPAQQGQPLDVAKMNLGPLLMQKLHIDEAQLAQLMNALRTVKSPQEAIAVIKSFDNNPETMNQPLPQAAPAGGTPGIAV